MGLARGYPARLSGIAKPALQASSAQLALLTAMCVLASGPAHAAEPRDAIKQMPTISHTSTFDWQSGDDPDTHTYSDLYKGEWKIQWRPRAVDLGSAKLQYELQYTLTLADNINRISGVSDDTRYDLWYAKARLTTPRELKAHYQLTQQDTYSNSRPTNVPTRWNAVTERQAAIEWVRSGWPQLSIGQQTTHNTSYVGRQQSDSDEVDTASYAVNYEHESGNVRQQYKLNSEMQRTSKGTSRDNLIAEAQREILLGPIGRINVGAKIEDYASNSPSSERVSTTTVSSYWLSLRDGRANGPLPLTYGFNYNVRQNDYTGRSGDQQVQRTVNLGLTPPVPEGKSASVQAKQYYSEFESANAATSSGETSLSWSFSPNPRTDSYVSYIHQDSTNRLSLLSTNDTETIIGNLSYRTPGNNSRYNIEVVETVTRKPDLDSRQTSTAYNLSSSVNLGPNTFVDMAYNQLYNSVYRQILASPQGNDHTLAQVRYHTAGQGLELNATWRMIHNRLKQTGIKKSDESINLTLSYQTQAKWKYTFVLDTKSFADPAGDSPLGYNYTSYDRIQFIVTHSF